MTERAYKYRFYPTVSQENLLRRTMGCVRLVYNKALATKTKAWYEKQERIDYRQTSSLLTSWKKTSELDFLNEVSCVPLQRGTTGIDRDINAGKNILAAGLAVAVCGADIRPDRHSSQGQLRKTRKRKKQKPK